MDGATLLLLELGKAVLVPSRVLMLALIVGAVLLWSRYRHTGRWLVTFSAAALIVVAATPAVWWVARPLEAKFPIVRALPRDISGIIVLGGPFHVRLTEDLGQLQTNAHSERLTKFAELARAYPDRRLVFSGGGSAFSGRRATESDLAKAYFRKLGLDVATVVFEDKSRNTCENAIETAKLMRPTRGDRWALVTSAIHMPRAAQVFGKAGFDVVPVPVDFTQRPGSMTEFPPNLSQNLRELDLAAHEWLAVLGYRILGCAGETGPG